MQVVIDKCFLLNPEKKLAQIRIVVFKKNAKTAPLIPKNDVTELKARFLGLGPQQGSCEYQLLKYFGLTRPGNRTLVYRPRGERSNH